MLLYLFRLDLKELLANMSRSGESLEQTPSVQAPWGINIKQSLTHFFNHCYSMCTCSPPL